MVICPDLTQLADSEATHCVQYLLKVDGYYGYKAKNSKYNASKYNAWRRKVGGYDWEIRFYHRSEITLELVFLSEPRANKVIATLGVRLVDPSGSLQPSSEKIGQSRSFRRASDSSGLIVVMDKSSACLLGYIKDESPLTMECAVTVFKDQEAIPVPPSNLPQHLGDLLETKAGVDVTFTVSGESFDAHKIVLATRSPVFMAAFFGEMEEKTSACVEIKEMEATVFKAMLHFIYTDTVPELDEKQENALVMAQHLLVAADRGSNFWSRPAPLW